MMTAHVAASRPTDPAAGEAAGEAAARSSAVAATGLSLTYPSGRFSRGTPVQALRDVSVMIESGEAAALLGPNGSGKSTLMRIISGTAQADRGEIAVLGSSDPRVYRARMGVVFQQPGLDPYLTVSRNLMYAARLYGMSRADAHQRIAELLDTFGLADRSRHLMKTLSGGLARRVDLCRALLHRPQLLLFDEPTVGLDPTARQQFLDVLLDLNQRQSMTLLMSTHLIDEAERMHRVLMLHEGSVVADDSPERLRHSAGEASITITAAKWNPPLHVDGQDVAHWQQTSGGWTSLLTDSDPPVSTITAALATEGIPFTYGAPSLADVYEQRTGSTYLRDQQQAGQE